MHFLLLPLAIVTTAVPVMSMPMNVEKVPMFECRLSTLWIGVRHNVVDVRTSVRKVSCHKTDRSGESVSKDDDVGYIWAFNGIIILWSHITVLSTDRNMSTSPRH
jgi:hypothetical protein